MASWAPAMFGDTLVGKDGEVVNTVDALKDKVVGVYFSAHCWAGVPNFNRSQTGLRGLAPLATAAAAASSAATGLEQRPSAVGARTFTTSPAAAAAAAVAAKTPPNVRGDVKLGGGVMDSKDKSAMRTATGVRTFTSSPAAAYAKGGGGSGGGGGLKSPGKVREGSAYQTETRKIILSLRKVRKVTDTGKGVLLPYSQRQYSSKTYCASTHVQSMTAQTMTAGPRNQSDTPRE
jgi:hypothetical protein